MSIKLLSKASFEEKGILFHKRLSDERLADEDFQALYLEHLQRVILLKCLESRCAELDELNQAFDHAKLTMDATRLYQVGQILENHSAIAFKWRNELAAETDHLKIELEIFQLAKTLDNCEIDNSEIENEITA